ncbi:MAG TPA: PUA domain-containing protein [Nitrososphaera sp.]
MTTTAYRKPTQEERTRINRALNRWGVFEFFKEKLLMVQENDKKITKMTTIYLVPKELEELAAMQPIAMGLAIGVLRKEFVPTVAGADLFARLGRKENNNNRHYVTVNENAEKLVLYGRDIMGDSIKEASDMLDENELVAILNVNGEAIGVGRTRFAGRSLFQKGKITITTIADAGCYLREEG